MTEKIKQGINEFLQSAELARRLAEVNEVPVTLKVDLYDIVVSKVLDGKSKPLLISINDEKFVYKRTSAENDIMAMKFFALCNSIWEKEHIDARAYIYNVISSGGETIAAKVAAESTPQPGEDTQEVEPVAYIQYIQSLGSFDSLNDSYWNPLRTATAEQLRQFVRSFVGATIAGYALGVRDRHNGNYLVSERFEVSHIDFDHIWDDQPALLPGDRISFPSGLHDVLCELGLRDEVTHRSVQAMAALRAHQFELFHFVRENVSGEERRLQAEYNLRKRLSKDSQEIEEYMQTAHMSLAGKMKDVAHRLGQVTQLRL